MHDPFAARDENSDGRLPPAIVFQLKVDPNVQTKKVLFLVTLLQFISMFLFGLYEPKNTSLGLLLSRDWCGLSVL